MKNIQHFIWDFDGTLLDTYANITRYLQHALEDFGYEVSRTDIMEKMMVSIVKSITYYAQLYQLPELEDRYKQYYAQEPNDPVSAFENVPEVLAQIRKNGGHNYIFTNRNDSIYPMLEKTGILEYFEEIVTSTSPHFKLKPAPDAILYLMEKYGGTEENTAMVGDRICDLGSAYAAGCRTIHLLTPTVPQYPDCDWRIENYKQMLEQLQ